MIHKDVKIETCIQAVKATWPRLDQLNNLPYSPGCTKCVFGIPYERMISRQFKNGNPRRPKIEKELVWCRLQWDNETGSHKAFIPTHCCESFDQIVKS